MTRSRTRPDALWRTAATEAEMARVEEIDQQIVALVRERSLITNRACSRARRQAKHQASSHH